METNGQDGATVRITTKLVLDWDGNVLERESYEWNGPVALLKGPSAIERQNALTSQESGATTGGEAQRIDNTLSPFFQQEMNSPTGIGQLGINQLTTAGGEATAGALGAGTEAANLRASRMGNPSSSASIIDAIARSGMQRQAGNAMNANMEDLQAKLQQQQQGASGLAKLGSEEQNAALDYLGLSNKASSDVQNQEQAQFNSIIEPIEKTAGAAIGAFA